METCFLDNATQNRAVVVETQKIEVRPSEVSEEVPILGERKLNDQNIPIENSRSLKAITEISNETIYNKFPPKPISKEKEDDFFETKKSFNIENENFPQRRRKTIEGIQRRKNKEEDSEDDRIKDEKIEKMKGENEQNLTIKLNDKNKRTLKRYSSAKQYNFQKYRPPAINVKNLKEQFHERIPSEDYGGHIFMPTSKMLEKQKDLTETILDLKKCKSRTPFLYLAIPLGTMMTFEVIILKDNLFSREYQFWLGGQQGKVLLMQGKKNLKLLEDYYIINEYLEGLNYCNFIAKLQSNTSRKQFLLSNQIEHISDPNKVLFADINVCDPIDDRSSVAVYFPSFQKITGVQTIIQKGRNRNILKQLLKDKYPVSFLSPCSLDKKVEKQFQFENGLLPTKRGLTLMDQNGWPKLYTAKLDHKRYRIYASSGVSPLIIFATFIVLYQS